MTTTHASGRQQGYDSTGWTYESGRYGEPHMNLYHSYRSEMLVGALNDIFGATTPLKLLEVGCGTGMTLDHLSRLPARHTLTGLDFSQTMLAQAGQKAAESPNPPTLVHGSAYDLPFPDGSFDAVYATRFIHQFNQENKKKIFCELMRVTREGGAVILEFYARPYHALRYYLLGLWRSKAREAYFEHYPTRREVGDVVSGKYRSIPVRIAGARIVHFVLGRAGVRSLTAASAHFPLRVLTDEYFVVARK